MTWFKIILMGGIWTFLVLVPFAVSVAILRFEVKVAVLILFLVYFCRRWKELQYLSLFYPLKYMLFAGVLFSSLTSLFYRLFIFFQFECLGLGCGSSQYLSILASVTSIGTLLFFVMFIIRERSLGFLIDDAIPKLNDSAGLVGLLVVAATNVLRMGV